MPTADKAGSALGFSKAAIETIDLSYCYPFRFYHVYLCMLLCVIRAYNIKFQL